MDEMKKRDMIHIRELLSAQLIRIRNWALLVHKEQENIENMINQLDVALLDKEKENGK